MKTMKDYIQRHAGLFDTEEPDQGHMERFTGRMNAMHAGNMRNTRNLLLRIAAVLLLGVVISYIAFRSFGLMDIQFNSLPAEMTNRELNEAEQFYTEQLSIYYDKIQTLRFNNDQAEKNQVLRELSTMDEQVQAMKHDLEQNPHDERIVHAIINFYQVKIELMDVIIARAQQANNSIL